MGSISTAAPSRPWPIAGRRRRPNTFRWISAAESGAGEALSFSGVAQELRAGRRLGPGEQGLCQANELNSLHRLGEVGVAAHRRRHFLLGVAADDNERNVALCELDSDWRCGLVPHADIEQRAV